MGVLQPRGFGRKPSARRGSPPLKRCGVKDGEGERIRTAPFRKRLLIHTRAEEQRRQAVVPFVAPRLVVDPVLLIALMLQFLPDGPRRRPHRGILDRHLVFERVLVNPRIPFDEPTVLTRTLEGELGREIWVYPGFPTIFRGLSGFFVGDLRKKPCGSSWKTRSVFQGAVGALCASTAPSASTGPVRVRQNGSRGGNGELDRRRPRTAVDP